MELTNRSKIAALKESRPGPSITTIKIPLPDTTERTTPNLLVSRNMDGYHKVSRFMGEYDDCAIFKKFLDTNIQNLLYYQAEILELKEDFDELAKRDLSVPGRSVYHQSWQSLSWSDNPDDMEQWEKWLEIRQKLKEYNETLSHVTALSALKPPDPHNLDFLRHWIRHPLLGNFPLRGKQLKSWNEPSDLLALNQRDESDSLLKWFARNFTPLYHTTFIAKSKAGDTGEPISEFTYYPESRFITLIDVIRTSIATFLPIISIITLSLLTNPYVRLGLAVGFTVVFSIALMLFTQGRNVEIFAVTSAFAAIQVVFIGGNGGFVPY